MFDQEPDTVSLPDLEARVCTWAGRITAATCHWLVLVATFDRRKAWANGMASCAHLLSWRFGVGLRACYEYVRAARALEDLPQTREAFGHGRISYSKVRAITRIATPENEGEWVTEALRCSARKLDRLVSLQLKIDDDSGSKGTVRAPTTSTAPPPPAELRSERRTVGRPPSGGRTPSPRWPAITLVSGSPRWRIRARTS
ncbi:DUF222 domain-containing protein [Frankia canadensis]|nr:DUF222 domain-containing protein [Frankia canadensis]